MPHTNIRRCGSAAAALLILLLASVGLVACGGSSSNTSSSANAAATGTAASSSSSTSGTSSTGASSTGSGTSTTPGTGRGPARFAAMRECLQKNGITLPKRTPGSTRPPAGTSRLGLPKGVSPAQYEAAVKKCGGGRSAGGFGGARRLNNPVFKAALTKYATCLRQNGINVPTPNTSGGGPIFNTKGINTASPQFKAASMKCRSVLLGAFKHPAGAPGAGGAPPAGGSASGSAPAGGESSG